MSNPMVSRLREAIRTGEKRTRKEWAKSLGVTLNALCSNVDYWGLQAACSRTYGCYEPSGTLPVHIRKRASGDHVTESVVIPVSLLRQVNLDKLPCVAFEVRGEKIIISRPKLI